MRTVSFTVRGEPVPKGRPRVTRYGTYTPPKTKEYEKRIQDAWRVIDEHPFPTGTPVSVSVHAYFEIPQSVSQKKRKAMHMTPHIKHRADVDNLAKAVLDALDGIAYADDCAVSVLQVSKSNVDGESFTFVELRGEEAAE